MRLLSIALLLTTSACLTPRSMMLGQMASPLGYGAAEVGVTTGIGYSQQTTTTPGTTNQSTGARVWTVPAVEGNAHFGLSDRVGINAHFSSAGIQPGLKITVNRPNAAAHFAIMPQLAIGYAHVRSALYVTDAGGAQTENAPGTDSMLTFMGGLRLMVSHKAGFFAGIGGDFIATRYNRTRVMGTGNNGTPVSDVSNTLQLAVAVNVGFSISVGFVRIRPELGFQVNPWLASGSNSDAGNFGGSGGFGWALLPGFSLVAATPKSTRDVGAEEDEKNVGPSEEKERDSDEERDDRDDREERDP